jgi:MarR family transcriptional regulator, organic hydroperoxide resistance regulator
MTPYRLEQNNTREPPAAVARIISGWGGIQGMDGFEETLPAPRKAAGRRDAKQAVPERGIGNRLGRAERAFRYTLQDLLAAHDVTVSQWLHLRNLSEADGLTQTELSQRIGIEKASSTAVLANLEARKFVRRVRNVEDRRKANLFLTDSGAAFLRRLIPCAVTVNAVAKDGLSQAELVVFLRVLDTMTENLLRSRRAPHPFGDKSVDRNMI